MRIAVVSHKGGVGKTTTAVHLAAYLATLAPTVFLDGDDTENALAWSRRGSGFPFTVAKAEEAGDLIPRHTHAVIDTGQRQTLEDLRHIVAGCDVVVIPSAPASLDVDGLGQTIRALRQVGPDKFRVLLTKVSADALKDAAELRELLATSGAAVLTAEIPRLKAYEKAAAAGQIVNQTDDRNAGRAWQAYAAAGKELTA